MSARARDVIDSERLSAASAWAQEAIEEAAAPIRALADPVTARAGADAELGVMLPMVADPDEVVATRELLEHTHADLAARGVCHAWPVHVGIMVEIPATALGIGKFRYVCDFYSIGTNDLTQYTLAAGRNNARVARFHDAGHPAVVGLCHRVVERGGRPTSVCGEAAGDSRVAPALVAAGVRKLSMAPPLFSHVRRALTR